jgi:hypothetical protein
MVCSWSDFSSLRGGAAEAEARERQAHGMTAPSDTGESTEHAARDFGVSPRYIAEGDLQHREKNK